MAEDKPHPITLQRVVFTRCVVIAIPGHAPNPDAVTPGPTNQINVSREESAAPARKNFVVAMRTILNPELDVAFPYSVDMECLGYFTVDDTIDEVEAKRAVTITAHNVQYGAIREAVAWITGRQPYGQLMFGLSVLRSAAQDPAAGQPGQAP